MTDIGLFLRNLAVNRAIGRPQSDKSMTRLSPYLLIATDTPSNP